MFYQPFNPKTLKVYDLTRSTLIAPYELDYGVSKVACDRSYYSSLEKILPIHCMLSPKERELSQPHLFLNKEEFTAIIDYSIKFLDDPDDYRIGYTHGYDDVVNFNCRKTFENENLFTVSFLVGYEAGVYAAIMLRNYFKNSI